MRKLKVGILGVTGMVGQRFVTLLKDHPWFEVVCLAASPRSAGKKYKDAVKDRWLMDEPIPKEVQNLKVFVVEDDIKKIVEQLDFVFCALDMDKDSIKRIENMYAAGGIPVVSNNSANRWSEDVPMIIPEINPHHLDLIQIQQKNRGYKKSLPTGRQGFIVVKPNCSIQSYVPLLTALWKYRPEKVVVTTFQAVSGAGKNLKIWPEMQENVIPYIGGEEQKSEQEPLKIWGELKRGRVVLSEGPRISATCVRVSVEDGHLASVSVSFAKKPAEEQILTAWENFQNPLDGLGLPSAPDPFITVFTQDNRPQTHLDRMIGKGMGISVGRLRKDDILDYKFIGLSHNTIRGAAGGAILTAELLKVKGYL